MNEKKKKLLETGMKLFAQKGFHATSIQEIADKSGVSKGAFYLHFQSKEDLTLNIHDYYYKGMMEKVWAVKQREDLTPKESLAQQLQVLLKDFMKNKDFIIMHMRDNVNLTPDSKQFIQDMRKQSFRWTSENLLQIYGDELKPHIVDASILLEGMLQSYFKWMIIDEVDLDHVSLSNFLVRRMDDVIQGILSENEDPQIPLEKVLEHFPTDERKDTDQQIRDQLIHIRTQLQNIDLTKEKQDELENVLGVLHEELEKENPQPIVFQGMLAHFKNIPELQRYCEKIAEKLGIKLI
ncbi:TetR/AcrR family transcriptional regulator [Pontibacillus marinus]|uniref:HTH tetR-type domain-containing protein n=1 Tax=Pontibacillus marinus BH030004 = DSM 16465 TaxID=1385511 RepID=A0A0A5I5D5_9BACI|nr:TetR/AcrR family transcriptional regulator [Pontibacillus marinus]KGX91017.1 hypothetical protein N783_13300 [Pontibacillus marinus BH030004 = DSM 16465]